MKSNMICLLWTGSACLIDNTLQNDAVSVLGCQGTQRHALLFHVSKHSRQANRVDDGRFERIILVWVVLFGILESGALHDAHHSALGHGLVLGALSAAIVCQNNTEANSGCQGSFLFCKNTSEFLAPRASPLHKNGRQGFDIALFDSA